MCTVTFIPVKSGFFFTSNRDEKAIRKDALSPIIYNHGTIRLLYPKDADAGGSWIAANENGNVAVLLNGGFIKHIPLPPYKKSRGLIFLDIISDQQPLQKFLKVDLINIEPFTIIIFNNNHLYECRWDGNKTYYKQLEITSPHIWSSATLYDEETIKKRQYWYNDWLAKNPCPTQQEVMGFHRFAGDGDRKNDLQMNRNNTLFTVSITSIAITESKAVVHYTDLKNIRSYKSELSFATIALN